MGFSSKTAVQNKVPEEMVHKFKTKKNGAIEKYKARYVEKRINFFEGLKCFYIFAPRSKT